METLIVVGMLALFASVTMVVGVHAFNRSSVKDDRDLLVGVLQKARSEAMHGICTSEGCIGPTAHGVHITDTAVVLFEGTTYNTANSSNRAFYVQSASTHFSTSGDIIFAAGNADTASSSVTVRSGAEVVSIVAVGALGQISWSY